MKPFTGIFHKIINKSYQLIGMVRYYTTVFDSPNPSLLYTILYVWRNPIRFLFCSHYLLSFFVICKVNI